ncbi:MULTISPECIES: hypothetical protein [unclassified Sphingomonas]|uniref:hypothetical protein n=1 Tax=unclassified Sphingomonas TaxID=196159 RepID=UPI00226A7FD9|nr:MULTISPECIES: hypothetical protein [unclassified Sphingomonas]
MANIVSASFATLLTRFRRQCEDLEAAEDERDVDLLANASQETLVELSRTRAATAADMAAKITAVLDRQGDFGVVPLSFVREMLLDANALAANVAQEG